MAFSLEAMAIIPLMFSLVLQPVQLGPRIGLENVEQAKNVLTVTRSQVNPPHFYSLTLLSGGMAAVQASPQMMLELVDLTSDAWRPFSAIVSP